MSAPNEPEWRETAVEFDFCIFSHPKIYKNVGALLLIFGWNSLQHVFLEVFANCSQILPDDSNYKTAARA